MDRAGVRRIGDGFDALRSRNLLDRLDVVMNETLWHAGERLRRHWHGAGYDGLSSIDLSRPSVDGGSTGGLAPSEAAQRHRDELRRAEAAVGPRLLPYLFGSVVEGRPLAALRVLAADAGHARTAEALALERLRGKPASALRPLAHAAERPSAAARGLAIRGRGCGRRLKGCRCTVRPGYDRAMPIDLICLDADDTLWHNLRHFDETEAVLQRLLAPFDAAGVARETLERVEAQNLTLYGYGAKGFTLSMIETAIEVAGERLPVGAIAEILGAGRALLAHPVELLPGAEAALDALGRRGRLVLVTKGDLLHQETKLAASGLGSRFAAIEIVSDKTPDTYSRIFAHHGVVPDRALMAGDSMRSDVLPALAAGAWAAHVPHGVVWAHERAEAPAGEKRFRALAGLGELAGWVDEIG